MENTRIPKPALRVPTKIMKNGTAMPKRVVPTIPEDKLLDTKSSALAEKVQPKMHVLRRRSKSVTDLRPHSSKPAAIHDRVQKVPEKAAALKPGQKRPASAKSDDGESKPKVSKRIPDWDYKSRFLDLQKKHSATLEELKKAKTKLSDVNKLEEDVESLRENNAFLKEKLDSLEISHATLTNSNEYLSKENSILKRELSSKQDSFRKLQALYSSSQENIKEREGRIEQLEQKLDEIDIQKRELEHECKALNEIVEQLKIDNEDLENLRRELHNRIQDMKGNIRVFCRVRPPVSSEEHDKQLCSIFFPSDISLEIRKSRESVSTISGKAVDLKQEFTFDKVFPPEANQTEVFEELAQLVQSALDGYHVCVFAYGQTGSGKTYTMQGNLNDQGMIPRTVDLIFSKIEKLSITDWTYTITASFLEIYNENIRDLLVPNSSHNYELRYNEGRGVTVTNLKVIPISSACELRSLMEEANSNRAVAATDFNEHSSRSHSVTKIHLEGYNSSTKATYCGSINLVDLAGSESARTSSSERLTETKNINQSLATLGNVMLALHNKDPHIPYRNSKLTFLLQSCLGGNSKTLMFVNISPFEECFSESVNSLRFASKVKDIKMTARRNKTYCIPSSLTNKNY